MARRPARARRPGAAVDRRRRDAVGAERELVIAVVRAFQREARLIARRSRPASPAPAALCSSAPGGVDRCPRVQPGDVRRLRALVITSTPRSAAGGCRCWVNVITDPQPTTRAPDASPKSSFGGRRYHRTATMTCRRGRPCTQAAAALGRRRAAGVTQRVVVRRRRRARKRSQSRPSVLL